MAFELANCVASENVSILVPLIAVQAMQLYHICLYDIVVISTRTQLCLALV